MNPKLTVQSLQGTRAQILWAFFFAGHAMTVEELGEWTGRDRKTHYGHLNALCGAGLLAKQTMSHGKVLYLLGSEMLPALRAWMLELGSGAPELADGQMSENRTPAGLVVVNAESKLISPTITTITTTIDQMSEKRTPAAWEALAKALDEHKIIGKKRRELVECEWVDADYVQACVKYTMEERIWDQPVGMAITRMLAHWTVPEKSEAMAPASYSSSFLSPCEDCGEVDCVCPHAENCACIDCRRHFPERFCPFETVHEAKMLSRGQMQAQWTQRCNVLLKPGQRFCDWHQEKKKGDLDD